MRQQEREKGGCLPNNIALFLPFVFYLGLPGCLSQSGTDGYSLVDSKTVVNPSYQRDPWKNWGPKLALSSNGSILAAIGYNTSWVFEQTGSVWAQQGPDLILADAVVEWGHAIAASSDGTTLAIGSYRDNGDYGAVWVLTYSAGSWTQQGAKLVAGPASNYSSFGRSVALSADGNTLAIGAYNDNEQQGATWVYTRKDGRWRVQGPKLVGSGAAGLTSQQGRSVALSADGNTLAVGGSQDDEDRGALWIFLRKDSSWKQLGSKLVGDASSVGSAMGEMLAMSADGRTLVAGASDDSGDLGAAYVFALNGDTWVQQAKLVPLDVFPGSRAGDAVSISGNGNTVAIRAERGGAIVGATWVFKRSGGAWTQFGDRIADPGAVFATDKKAAKIPGVNTGVAISEDSRTLAIGGTFDGNLTGGIWIYTCPSCASELGPPAAPPSSSSDSKTSVGIIVGAVLGSLLLLICCCCCFFAAKRRRSKRDDPEVAGQAASFKAAATGVSLLETDSREGTGSVVANSSKEEIYPWMHHLVMQDSYNIAVDEVGTPKDEDKLTAATRSSATPSVQMHGTSSDDSTLSRRLAMTTARWSACGSDASSMATASEILQAQLDDLHTRSTQLCGRFKVGDRSDRRIGGQGVVQFACNVTQTKKQYAIKFYLDRDSFLAEQTHLTKPSLHHIIPAVDDIVDSQTDAIHVLGRPLPPMVVIEKGESLDEWQRRCQADSVSAMHIMMHLVQRAADMHAAGVVHRDLKPANVILYPARNEWTIIDFGGAAEMGTMAPLTYTLAYAAPETIMNRKNGVAMVVADAAVDVWALGVMAWELLTRSRLFPNASGQQVEAILAGNELLPWEKPTSAELEASMAQLGFMRDGVLSMLEREPSKRTTLSAVVQKWRSRLQHDGTSGLKK